MDGVTGQGWCMMGDRGVQEPGVSQRSCLPSTCRQMCILMLCMFGRWMIHSLLFVYIFHLFWIFLLDQYLTYDFPPLPYEKNPQLWLLILLEDWKRSKQAPFSRWLIQCDHKPRTTFWDYLGPAVTAGPKWWLACLANSKDLINKIFEILPITMETYIGRITNCQLNGKIVGECIQLLMTCRTRNEY